MLEVTIDFDVEALPLCELLAPARLVRATLSVFVVALLPSELVLALMADVRTAVPPSTVGTAPTELAETALSLPVLLDVPAKFDEKALFPLNVLVAGPWMLVAVLPSDVLAIPPDWDVTVAVVTTAAELWFLEVL